MQITVETLVEADISAVWNAWNTPEDIVKWNAASDDWNTTSSTVDLMKGGKFISRMEAKDASMGFDFEGEYTRVIEPELIEYAIADGRTVKVEFDETDGGVRIIETFEAETTNTLELQKEGWQAILDNFKKYVEGG